MSLENVKNLVNTGKAKLIAAAVQEALDGIKRKPSSQTAAGRNKKLPRLFFR